MSGGSKAPKETTTKTVQEPPAEAKPYIQPFMDTAWDLGSRDFTPYTGTTVAPLSDQHLQALSGIQQRATNGSPVVNAAKGALGGTLDNTYLNYGMSVAGQDNPWQNATNRYLGARTNVGTNALLGLENPYLNQAINYAQQDVQRGYNQAVLPQFAAMDRASGSFGNSGIQEMKLEAQRQLANELGGLSSNMRMQDYGLQANLSEQDVARRAQYEAGDLARNAQIEQSDLARNAGLAETQLDRLLNTYQAERNNQMQGMQFAPQIAAEDYKDLQALMGAGDVMRSYQGEKLAEQQANWMAEQQWPYQQLDVLANALRTTMGGGGTTTVTEPNPYQPSRYASAIGGGALGYSGAQAMGMSPWMGGLIGAGTGYAMG